MSFRELSDNELQRLTDEQLIEYIRQSRSAGQMAAGRRALMIIVYGQERRVTQRLKLRMPNDLHAVDDVAHDVLVVCH